jgi:MFS family permease
MIVHGEGPGEPRASRVEAAPRTDAGAGLRPLLFMGSALMILLNLSAPMGGLLDIPVSFFLKNRLHLRADQLAMFKLWTGLPLFLSFVFGFLRDRWSPFGRGDRGHLVLFGLVTAVCYVIIALTPSTYTVLLAGLFASTVTFQVVSGAAYGLISSVGQRRALTGFFSVVVSIAFAAPVAAASLLGGVFSRFLEGQDIVDAMRILFLVGAGLVALLALVAAMAPKAAFMEANTPRSRTTFLHDISRLVRHRPLYPVILIQLLWQFTPGTGVVLQYHMANTMHATDDKFGAFIAIYLVSMLPAYALYGFLCRRVRLSRLLWIGFSLVVFQLAPLLFIHTVGALLLAAIPMGLIGGIAQAALTDLAIRSCPAGLQGTFMLLFTTSIYYVAVRCGDVFGADLYDHHGGFATAILATIGAYALILPLLWLTPRHLISTTDGQSSAEGGPETVEG